MQEIPQEIPHGFCHCGCGRQTVVARYDRPDRGIKKGEPYNYIHGHSCKGIPKTSISSFWDKVARGSEDECWEWLGKSVRNGYGAMGYNNRLEGTHRLAWMFTNGEIKDGLQVCHKCDNPACCNPSHLFLGTGQDNMSDKVQKGRHVAVRGERNGATSLTWEDVCSIRELCRSGVKKRDIAIQYGVSVSTVKRIWRNDTWRFQN